MQVCYTSDLHGSAAHYDALEDLLRATTPDLLVLGGDLLPDGVADDPVGSQVAYVHHVFAPRIETYRDGNPGLRVACLVGNHEWQCAADALAEYHRAGVLVLLTPEAPWTYGGVTFVGYPCTPPTPHTVKDFERLDLPGDEIPAFGGAVWDASRQSTRDAALAEHFERRPTIQAELAGIPHVAAPWILVAHAPPHDTKLDRLPAIPIPIGSRAIRAFILERQPLVTLHGHIHEGPEVSGSVTDRLGATLCINPGQDRARLYAVTFGTDDPAGTLRHTVFS
jgi:Icc-related predicted phosphoesterase